MSKDNLWFVRDLVSAIPELEPLLSNHLVDNDELLPHVFMGDLTRFVATTCHAMDRQTESGLAATALLQRITSRLEEALTSGAEPTKELIVVSFVENLWGEGTAVGALTSLLGPALEAEMRSHGLIEI